jgi:hypothetical protein
MPSNDTPIDHCPYCGERAVLRHDSDNGVVQYIECANNLCNVRLTDWGGQGTEWLVKAWNRRVK